MKIKDIIKKLEAWENYKECDLKVRVDGKDLEIKEVYGSVPDLFLDLKDAVEEVSESGK